jgi:hypothetical protein
MPAIPATPLSRAESVRICRHAEAVVGSDRVGAWLTRAGPTSHRLGQVLRRLDDFVAGRLTPLQEDMALLNAAEADSVLALADEWQPSPAWPEVRRQLRAANEYLHAVGCLAVGTMLKQHHPATRLVVATGQRRHPDLNLEVSELETLAVEVKAPTALWRPQENLDGGKASRLVRAAVANAGLKIGQLRGQESAVLAIAGLLIGQTTYDTIVRSFEAYLRDEGRRWPHLLGLAVFNIRLVPSVEANRVIVQSEQQSVIRRNPLYRGRLYIDDDWSRQWRLVRR